MHYDDGMDTQPGEDLSLGHEDLGPASYDVNGDGVADSHIQVSGDEVQVLTDSNGDGQVDTEYDIASDGTVQEYQQGEDGNVVQVGTGHLDADGRIVMDGSGSGTGVPGGDGGPGDGGVTGTDAGHSSGDMTLQDDGQTVDVGAPTIDLTGDGVNDTVALQGTDGSTVLVADTDQDGQADNIAQINPDGSVTFAVPDGHGGWVVAGHGHVDASGSITQDSGGQTGQPYQPPVDLEQGQPTGTSDSGTGTPGTDTGTTGTGTASGSGEDITVTMNGQSYDVGQATIDSDGNGTPDTAVVQADDGTTLLVTDANGDGTGDQIVQVNPDGSAVVQQSDGHGDWETVATGHVDANGNLVIDQQAGGTSGAPDDQGTGTAAGTTAGDPGTATGVADPGTDATTTGAGTASGSGEDITVTMNGQSYDVGAATVDADGNGTPDTAVVQADDGTTLLVTDVNGDGTGDQIVQVNPDGSVAVQQSDGHGDWETVATGHLDANGNLVVDQQ